MAFASRKAFAYTLCALLCVQVPNGQGLDEQECSSKATCFKCLNSQDIIMTREQICDGQFDCEDLSDEFLCPDKRLKYDSRLQYALASLNTGVDLLQQDSAVELVHRMCIPHCVVPSHVLACNYCKPGQFVCSPIIDPNRPCKCVDRVSICDGVMDCPSGEDENYCSQGMNANPVPSLNNTNGDEIESTMSPVVVDDVADAAASISHNASVAEKIVYLANSRISCAVIQRMSNFSRSHNPFHTLTDVDGPNRPGRRPVFRPGSPGNIFRSRRSDSENDENRRPDISVLLNWVSHSRPGDPSPIQKYITSLLQGDLNGSTDFVFKPGQPIPEDIETVKIDKLCDGVIDCGSFADEILCPGKFYCENREPLYIDKMRIMDGVADCSDSSDEWPITRGHHTLASRYNLIGNWTLQVLVWVMGITALLGNIVVMWSTIIELIRTNSVATASAIIQKHSIKDSVKEGTRRRLSSVSVSSFAGGSRRFRTGGGIGGHRRLVKTWNSVLVLNLATADLLMGIYLMWLAIMSALYEGQSNTEQQYWTFDREWRTSTTCNVLGSILLTSSQTSVYTLVALTTLRLYTVVKPFTTYHLKFRYLFSVCFITWFCSLLLAITPMIPGIKESFIKAAWVPFPQFHPPDINLTMADNLVRGIAYITNRTITDDEVEFANMLSWSRILEFIKVVAPHHSNWKFYGYYSEDSVCMPKLFVSPDTDRFWGHAAALITMNFLSVVYIAIAYLIIYIKSTTVQGTPGSIRSSAEDTKKPIDEPVVTDANQKMPWSRRRSVITHREGKPRYKVDERLRRKYQLSKRGGSQRSQNKLRQSKNSASEMQRRIALLVATDCVCWIPICIMSFISMTGHTIPDTAYAITAIGLLPINSALNPLLYSRFMRTLWARGWSSLRARVSSSFTSSTASDSLPGDGLDVPATKKVSNVSAITIEENVESDDEHPEKENDVASSTTSSE